MLTLGQQQVHFEFTQSNYLLVTFVRMVLSIVKGEFWYQMVSQFSQCVCEWFWADANAIQPLCTGKAQAI